MSDAEQLDDSDFGIRGIEKAQNYEPMAMANPDPPSEPAFDTDTALAKHLQRPAPPEPIERTYSDVSSGEPTPDNQTLELDRASRDSPRSARKSGGRLSAPGTRH
jgi:hypothetical protein